MPQQPFRMRECFLPFVALLALYLSTLSNNLSASHDSIQYLNQIDAGKELFHPHHLLFNAAARTWLRGWRLMGAGGDSSGIVAAMNALFGALTAAVFYLLLRRRLGLSPATALGATAILAFSYGFWFHSVCIEVYIIPVFGLLSTLYFLTDENAGPLSFALAGLAHGFTVLFHQVHVLFGLAVIMAAVIHSRGRAGQIAKRLAAYAAVALPVAIVPYLFVMIRIHHIASVRDAMSWLTLYAHEGAYWKPLAPKTAALAAVGFGRTLIGGRFLFALPGSENTLGDLLGDKMLADDAFTVRGIGPSVAALLLALSALAVLAYVAAIVQCLRGLRGAWPARRVFLLLLATWLVPYCLFFFFWDSSNVEMWIPQAVCVWLGIWAVWSVRPPLKRPLAGVAIVAMAALLLAANLFGSILPTHSIDNDYYYRHIIGLDGLASEGDLVVLPQVWLWKANMTRYLPSIEAVSQDVFAKECATPEEFAKKLKTMLEERLAAGHRIFAFEETIRPSALTRSALGVYAGAAEGVWREYIPQMRKTINRFPYFVYILSRN